MPRTMTLADFAKTPEYEEIVQLQNVFCVDGLLFQGFRGGPMPVEETQLTIAELDNVDDRDGTMHRVWFRLMQRLELRHNNKSREYGKRRKLLREERGVIRQAIRDDKETGLPVNPEDIAEIERIDQRMKLLRDPGLEVDYLHALERSKPPGERMVQAKPAEDRDIILPSCPECGELVPPGKDFKKWLNGHRLGKHTARRGRKKAKTA